MTGIIKILKIFSIVYQSLQVSDYLLPTMNYGAMKNVGFDFEVGSAKQFGDFGYNVNLNMSHYKNEVTKILTPSYGNYIIKEGLPWNSHYMVEWIGIFQNQAEIDEGPTHQFNPKPGDLKFKDQLTVDTNNDGVPDKADGKIDANDRVVVPGVIRNYFMAVTLISTGKLLI